MEFLTLFMNLINVANCTFSRFKIGSKNIQFYNYFKFENYKGQKETFN